MSTDAAPPCEFLPWDSDFFRCRIGRVHGQELAEEQAARIDEWSRGNNIRCLYFLAGPESPMTIRVAERHGFRLVDVRLTFSWSTEHRVDLKGYPKPPTTLIRQAEQADLAQLQLMARKGYEGTRFFNDLNFPRDRVEELYSTWITLDCEGRSERVLIAASQTNEPLGYLSCVTEPASRRGQIGLIGVSRALRGKGLGGCLVRAACEWFAEQGIQEVAVVTQGSNRPAQRLYQRCGFQLHDLKLWYHKWYS